MDTDRALNALRDCLDAQAGDVIADALESRLYCAKHDRAVLSDPRCLDRNERPLDCKKEGYLPLSCCEGYVFSGPSKVNLVDHLRNVIAVGYHSRSDPLDPFGWLRCPPIPQLEEELSFYSWDDKRLMTDCLFALGWPRCPASMTCRRHRWSAPPTGADPNTSN